MMAFFFEGLATISTRVTVGKGFVRTIEIYEIESIQYIDKMNQMNENEKLTLARLKVHDDKQNYKNTFRNMFNKRQIGKTTFNDFLK